MPEPDRPETASPETASPETAGEAERRSIEDNAERCLIEDEAERRFIEDLVARGEAVPEGTQPKGTGPLPSNATHEIVEECDGVPTKVRRRRFSLSDDPDPSESKPDRGPSR